MVGRVVFHETRRPGGGTGVQSPTAAGEGGQAFNPQPRDSKVVQASADEGPRGDQRIYPYSAFQLLYAVHSLLIRVFLYADRFCRRRRLASLLENVRVFHEARMEP